MSLVLGHSLGGAQMLVNHVTMSGRAMIGRVGVQVIPGAVANPSSAAVQVGLCFFVLSLGGAAGMCAAT